MIQTKTNPQRRVASGEVEACCHRIDFYYDIGDQELSEEDLADLESEAEDRAKTMIVDGYISGELCYLLRDDDTELHGWWSIKKD